MRAQRTTSLVLAAVFANPLAAQAPTQVPSGATSDERVALAGTVRPSPRQLRWQATGFNAFVHFGMNTFTDREWGDGTESPATFAPSDFDAGQWARTFRDAGMRGLVLTCKHHDGFCLWPSATTTHDVASSPFRGGAGDVVLNGGVVGAGEVGHAPTLPVLRASWPHSVSSSGEGSKTSHSIQLETRTSSST